MTNPYTLHKGDSIDLLSTWTEPLDLVVTDPPYAFGGSGTEHAVTATVACVLRETAAKLKSGSWMIVFSASSWRSISYMIESVRGIVEPVRIGTWTKPVSRTKVRTVGWSWGTVSVIAFRKGPKNRKDSPDPSSLLDHISSAPVSNGRRAELPESVAKWAVSPFAISNGVFLDPFCGSGALPKVAASLGMQSHGFEINPPEPLDCEILTATGKVSSNL